MIQKRDVEKVQEEPLSVINPSQKVKDLEKQLRFSESFENRVKLADAYLDEKIHEKAIEHYDTALRDNFKDDFT